MGGSPESLSMDLPGWQGGLVSLQRQMLVLSCGKPSLDPCSHPAN